MNIDIDITRANFDQITSCEFSNVQLFYLDNIQTKHILNMCNEDLLKKIEFNNCDISGCDLTRFTSLKSVAIYSDNCNELPKLPNIESLFISGKNKITSIQTINTLTYLHICGCPNLKSIKNLVSLTRLSTSYSSIELDKSLVNLEWLDLSEPRTSNSVWFNPWSPKTIKNLDKLPNLKYLALKHETCIIKLPIINTLEYLDLYRVTNLIGLDNYPNLKTLHIEECSKLIYSNNIDKHHQVLDMLLLISVIDKPAI
jgi:hypothetical protein